MHGLSLGLSRTALQVMKGPGVPLPLGIGGVHNFFGLVRRTAFLEVQPDVVLDGFGLLDDFSLLDIYGFSIL